MFKLPKNYIDYTKEEKIALIESLLTEYKTEPELLVDMYKQFQIEDYKNTTDIILIDFLSELEKRINFLLDYRANPPAAQEFEYTNLTDKITNRNFLAAHLRFTTLYTIGEYEESLFILRKICLYDKNQYPLYLPYIEKCKSVINKSKDINKIYPKILKFFKIHKLVRCKYCGKYTNYEIIPPIFAIKLNRKCDNCRKMYFEPSYYWDGWTGMDEIFENKIIPYQEFYDEYSLLKEKQKNWLLSYDLEFKKDKYNN